MSNDFEELFMQFLRDKKTATNSVMNDIQTLQSLNKGLTTFIENIETADINKENIRQKFRTLMKLSKTQNNIISKLTTLLLVYIQGNSFDRDVAILLNNLGRGEEALKQMLKNKMEGK